MPKNYSFYMFGVFLGIGLLVGLAFPSVLQLFTQIPPEDRFLLYLLAIAAGLFTGAAIFLVNHSFNRYIIGHFREVLARVQDEDYSARVRFSGQDMLGLLGNDVNCTLSQLKEKSEEALHDDLTGLPNRQFLKQYYRRNKSRLAEERTAFLFFDLDKFKDINDQFGHLYGDRVLVKVAERVHSALAEDEFLVRLSGDEFLLVAKLSEECTGKDLAEQLTSLFTEPYEIHDTFLQVQTSIGVSTAPAHGTELGELIRKADFAMYKAKKIKGVTYYISEEKMERAKSLADGAGEAC
ncbi:GGDEF domain-containing protein [Planococcus sp. CAU13]|uniref:GGDEF domain-containing protein n=1 Tax=Planococcus sp. CAU13 TaxID=1541197 RepID=UPI00068EE023|nr:GGDEF domain-containing protein [Planococcus sp. CAU13]